MAPELIDHFALTPKVAKPGGVPPPPACAGCGRRLRRNPRGTCSTVASFHRHCWFTVRRPRRPRRA